MTIRSRDSTGIVNTYTPVALPPGASTPASRADGALVSTPPGVPVLSNMVTITVSSPTAVVPWLASSRWTATAGPLISPGSRALPSTAVSAVTRPVTAESNAAVPPTLTGAAERIGFVATVWSIRPGCSEGPDVETTTCGCEPDPPGELPAPWPVWAGPAVRVLVEPPADEPRAVPDARVEDPVGRGALAPDAEPASVSPAPAEIADAAVFVVVSTTEPELEVAAVVLAEQPTITAVMAMPATTKRR